LVGWLVDVGWLACRLVGWFGLVGWVWLVGSVGQSVGLLVGWLAS